MNILIIFCGALFLYVLITKPELIAVLFFTITIADINFELGGLPINARALIGLALFGRTIISPKNIGQVRFLSNPKILLIIGFTLYTFLVTAFNDLITPAFVKQAFLTLIAVYCGYFYYMKRGDIFYLKISLILAALICFLDLGYTYSAFGEFPVQRVYHMLLGVPIEYDEEGKILEIINHNFYGLICGTAFVVIINDFINQKSPNKLILLLLPIMFLGVLMSTSRSTLLGIIVISIVLIVRELKHKERAQKAMLLITMAIGILFLSLFLFTTLQSYFSLESDFVERISQRLIDEPVAVFNKHLGMNYNANALEAMDWREEASADAFAAFMNLSSLEQIFGIGYWGFIVRDLGHTGLNPHNGFLLLLIETGLVGLLIYVILIATIIARSLKVNANIPPLVTTLIFIIFYCIGQNGELTSSITFLFVATLIAENEHLALQNQPKNNTINLSPLPL
ncbi:MAG: O-antigen ligase family protein [Chitinophagaceae bacterium]